MNFASIFVALAMFAVSVFHLAWALGSTFPAKDEKALALSVAGFRGNEHMPPRIASFIVSILTFGLGLWPFVASHFLSTEIVSGTSVFIAVGLGTRGTLGFTRWWRALTPEQPFAMLDRRYYSPLCLALGAAYLFIALRG